MFERRWLAASTLLLTLVTLGCEREARVPEPKVPEKAQLPAVNERIEREADQGTRPGTPPVSEPARDQGADR